MQYIPAPQPAIAPKTQWTMDTQEAYSRCTQATASNALCVVDPLLLLLLLLPGL